MLLYEKKSPLAFIIKKPGTNLKSLRDVRDIKINQKRKKVV